MKKYPALIDQPLPEAKFEGGFFVLKVNDNGVPFWSGTGGLDDKDGTTLNVHQPLILNPDNWPPGTIITATVPE